MKFLPTALVFIVFFSFSVYPSNAQVVTEKKIHTNRNINSTGDSAHKTTRKVRKANKPIKAKPASR